VEDSFLTAEGYRAILEGAGFSDIRLAAGREAALREAERLTPAVAIVDLQLDGQRTGGLELANALLRCDVGQVIIATGYHPTLVEAGRLIRPPAAILQKPVPADELLAAVRRCLGQPG
jgi:DNA-binding NarL/FixJ family response regulator